MAKNFGEWRLLEVALYGVFPTLKITGNYCSQAFMVAK
jgi:hypothetical protein